MVRTNPAQLVLAFDCPEDWAVEALEIARERVPSALVPAIEWTNYPTAAGRAYLQERKICLSRVVLKTHAHVYDTVLHEYAHLVVYARHGRKAKPHGPEWRQVMADLGIPPKVTHDYPVERRTVARRYSFRCNACGFILWRVRPFKRNRIYSHVGCGGSFS